MEFKITKTPFYCTITFKNRYFIDKQIEVGNARNKQDYLISLLNDCEDNAFWFDKSKASEELAEAASTSIRNVVRCKNGRR